MWRYFYRSSHSKTFYKKGVLKNFAKFTGKHLCQILVFNKVADLRPATLLKKRLWLRCFPVNFARFLRTLFVEPLLASVFSYTESVKALTQLGKEKKTRIAKDDFS